MTTYKKKIEWVQNDFGFDIPLRCIDEETGTPVDISGCTVKWRVAEKGAATPKFVGGCTITGDGTAGLCRYTVKAGDFDEPDKTYLTQLIVTKPGYERKFRGLTIHIEGELPES